MIYILPTTDLDTEAIRHDVLNRMTFTKNATVIECGSEAEALEDCSVQPRKNTACQYALVQCGLEEDPQDESPGKDDPDSTEPNNNGGSDASDESMDEGVNVDNTGDDDSDDSMDEGDSDESMDEGDSDDSMDEGDSDDSMDEGANVDNAGGDERKGLSVGVIAGVVVVVLVSLALVVVGVLILIVVKQR